MSIDVSKNESEILQQVAAGNEGAFRELYHRWQPPLASFVFKITKSKELTAEIVQDVFLRIWLQRDVLATVDNFKSYLFVACRNQALNTLKKNLRELARLEAWQSQQSESTSTQWQPIATNEQEEGAALIDHAIDNLSPRQREIYLLYYHQRRSYMEIAEQIGVGRETVKTHLQLAVRSVSKFLKSRQQLSCLIHLLP